MKRVTEFKHMFCWITRQCDYSDFCENVPCGLAKEKLKELNLTFDEVLAMTETEWNDLLTKLIGTINEHNEDGPYGGAFASDEDYMLWKEGSRWWK